MALSKNLLPLFLFILLCSGLQGTEKYVIAYFTNKGQRPEDSDIKPVTLGPASLDRRAWQGLELDEHDLPICSAYLDELTDKGINILGISRWLNAALISCIPETVSLMKTLPFIREISYTGHGGKVESDFREAYKTDCLQSDSIHALMKLGPLLQDTRQGQGLCIAVIDAGFAGADTIPAFKHLFSPTNASPRLSYKDFTSSKQGIFEQADHGTKVLSFLAAKSDSLWGIAPEANYLLYKTEILHEENPIEEFHLIQAMEHADSMGAWVLNVSLGYTRFDDKALSYERTHLNGKTSIASIAAAKCASRGMLFVTSAGNEALQDWKYISIPADADSILSVAAVLPDGNPAAFSSYSPDPQRAAPNISAPGVRLPVIDADGRIDCSYGTSFASPQIAGGAIALWQAYPTATAMQVRSAIIQSTSNYPNFQDRIGFGLPDFNTADSLLSTLTSTPSFKVRRGFLPHEVLLANEGTPKTIQIRLLNESSELIMEEINIHLKPWERIKLDLSESINEVNGIHCYKVSISEAENLWTIPFPFKRD
jgi:serine protease AprX